jgi:hypothetical protein
MRRALATALALLVIGAASAPGAPAAEVPDHALLGSITGKTVGPFEQFKDACGVAADAAGYVYVADYYQNRVLVFHKEPMSFKYQYVTKITNIDPLDAGGVAPIDGPCDLAVDSVGRVYVNDYHQDVVRFTPDQYPPQPAVAPSQLGTAYSSKLTIDKAHSTGVAVDPKTDDVYVDDRTYIAVYDSSGAPVMEGGGPLRIGEGSLKDAYSVAISSYPATEGWIYVADAASETVKVYDPAKDPEEPQFEIHGEGTTQGRFYLTDTDLAVDPEDGHLYLADDLEPHFEFTPEAVVDEFGPTGLYRGPVPRSFANGSPSFLQDGEPTGVAISPDDELFVTSGNYEDASVYIFGPPAPFATEILTLTKTGSGQGTVTSIPGGIGCGEVCEGEFNQETNVLLKATPAPGSAFLAWSGCDEEPAPGRCAVRMGSDRAVTAEFETAPGASAAPASAQISAEAGAVLAPTSPTASATRRRDSRARRHHKHRHAHPHRKARR